MVTPLVQQQARLTKRIRLGTTPAATAPTPDAEDEGMAEGLLENMLGKKQAWEKKEGKGKGAAKGILKAVGLDPSTFE